MFSVKLPTQILEIFQNIFDDIEEMDDITDVFFRDRATDIDFLVTNDEDCTGEYFDDGEEVNETWQTVTKFLNPLLFAGMNM